MACVGALTLLVQLGCVGTVSDTGAAKGHGGSKGPGAVDDPDVAPGEGDPDPGAAGAADAVGQMPLRRLTNREYNNTVHDLLGDDSRPADKFPSDRDGAFTFRRAGDVAVQDAEVLQTAAEQLAQGALRNLATLLPCDPKAAGEAACAGEFIRSFGLRAFRRPLAPTEVESLTALYGTARSSLMLSFADAISVLIEAMLQAPAFLYHGELAPGAPAARDGGAVPLTPYQVASRLSYFVWGSMPDQALLDAAAAGQLASEDAVATQARRLLKDPKARGTVAAFFSDLLSLDGLPDAAKDPGLYPKYNAALAAAMAAETVTFVQSAAFDGDGRWSTLLAAPYSYLDRDLAAVYGVAAPAGTALQKVALDPTQRSGLLTQASFLTVNGSATGSHPVRRGRAIYETFLCGEVPPPPANVPPAKPAAAGGTTRQRFVEHDTNECARACHSLMDPIGFAFEHYDGIGAYRTMDNNQPVDSSGDVTLDGEAHTVANAVELAKLLAASAEARACFATQWARFALQRPETPADAALQRAATAAFPADASFLDLVVAIAQSRPFRFRIPAAGEVLP